MKSKQVKRKLPSRVQIYFSSDQQDIYNDLRELSRITHRSASDLAYVFFIQLFRDQQLRDSILRGAGVSAVDVNSKKK